MGLRKRDAEGTPACGCAGGSGIAAQQAIRGACHWAAAPGAPPRCQHRTACCCKRAERRAACRRRRCVCGRHDLGRLGKRPGKADSVGAEQAQVASAEPALVETKGAMAGAAGAAETAPGTALMTC